MQINTQFSMKHKFNLQNCTVTFIINTTDIDRKKFILFVRFAFVYLYQNTTKFISISAINILKIELIANLMVFDKYTSTVLLPVVKMAMSVTLYIIVIKN